ncbi:MAG: hypothetical protein RMM29_01065 [Planctomycetota bacterium]|nr:hypothetical protein [Planctomycetota bacterium]MCX8040398.1 hypothetical protein [Planctomycetota bacterium]MDW8372226.1 hypothetical protein [Planctomycetota bacterium]
MAEPVLIAVPPKGGSFDDVVKRLAQVGWLRPALAAHLRRLLKEDKRRVKFEEGLIDLWNDHGGDREATMRAADRAGHDLGDVEAALARMRHYRDGEGRHGLDYSPLPVVQGFLDQWREDPDSDVREAAQCLHLQLDLTRPGKPVRVVFNQCEFEWKGIRGVLLGTEHEVTPPWLRRQRRDLSLTCYDAFHNTLLDVLDTGRVRNWQELRAHLHAEAAPVRILGSLGLDDYLGHCVLMARRQAERVRALGAGRRWAERDDDPKLALLREQPVLIDPAYADLYASVLDAQRLGIRFAPGPKDIERVCAREQRVAIYIVRSGSTVALVPDLCVVGEELVTSETIVAANALSLARKPGVRELAESLEPRQEDHAPAWRARLAARLGERLL